MQLYLDTSALAKLVVAEAESEALRGYLNTCGTDTKFSAALARTELLRAVAPQGSLAIVDHARRVLTRIDLVALTSTLLDAASALPPARLRTLDAIHLACALTAPALRAVVTYDHGMAQAAEHLGLAVVSPANPADYVR